MSTPPYRVLIVDDEPLSRLRLRTLLARQPDVALVGECDNAYDALRAIYDAGPELVFLDVKTPALDGLGVVDAIDEAYCPEIVFVTAHLEYLERAFELHALDYLRKPYADARFAAALAAARRRIQMRRCAAASPSIDLDRRHVLQALGDQARADRGDTRLRLYDPRSGRWSLVEPGEIEFVDVAGAAAAVTVHTRQETYPWAMTIVAAERMLAPLGFFRVHRGCVVNLANVRAVKTLRRGEYTLVMKSGQALDTGRTYRAAVEQLIGG